MTTPHEEVAMRFASALVAGDFERAHALLVPELTSTLAPADLRERFRAMFEGYAEGEPREVVRGQETREWPGRQPSDVGWAYVGVLGDDFVEGVTVTVADVGGELRIREVEWGRP